MIRPLDGKAAEAAARLFLAINTIGLGKLTIPPEAIMGIKVDKSTEAPLSVIGPKLAAKLPPESNNCIKYVVPLGFNWSLNHIAVVGALLVPSSVIDTRLGATCPVPLMFAV